MTYDTIMTKVDAEVDGMDAELVIEALIAEEIAVMDAAVLYDMAVDAEVDAEVAAMDAEVEAEAQ
jgi:predicted DsbA family dithiol-disulfide isomerase|tara:strand:- start:10212 stop:10406 length:195 start_codon:yes stop_codon:yes gene_type:complete